ncbi:MAG: hypothetical protein U9R02_03355 [Thermodesulfobacteriota bacterium]|nr:hypothetical protein [Thermodesulfobacteriota bacterium]
MLDIHAFSRLVSRAPQHLKLRTYFLPNPKDIVSKIDLPGFNNYWFVMVILGKNENSPKRYIDTY